RETEYVSGKRFPIDELTRGDTAVSIVVWGRRVVVTTLRAFRLLDFLPCLLVLLGVVRGADVVALLVVRVLAEVLAILLGDFAAFGRLLDRQADATALQVEIDDLH